MPDARYEYVIDGDDVITEVSEEWGRFAEVNDAAELAGGTIGSWLWQHFEGTEVKLIYRSLLDRARETGTPVDLPFRCDSPKKRRYMLLEAIPLPGNAVRLVSTLTSKEERPPVLLLDRGASRSDPPPVAMCAWCKRVRDPSGEWHEVETALAQMDIFMTDTFPKLNHLVCEDCRRAAWENIGDERTG